MNNTVLITGASRGIGKAIAELFAENGYNVVINYRSSDIKANELYNKLVRNNRSAMLIKADVAVREQVDEMYAKIKSAYGGVDVLINNAGIAEQKLFTDVSEDDWDNMFDINVKGMFNCTQAVLNDMISNKYGKIINISSIWGLVGASCEVAYASSKAAVIGFTKSLAKELGPSNICVNCIAPGIIDTDMNASLDDNAIKELKEQTPLIRLGSPEDIANLALYLASEKANFITGQIISPNGGFVI
ncbi:MAG: SDR family oxidoreductase [Eubacteriaceae bacterium]|nr:SDR family oxidoreductase [Eubacteriaceae bacterium]